MPRPWLRLRGGSQNVEDQMAPNGAGLSVTYSFAAKQRDAFDELFNRVKPMNADVGPWKVIVYDSHWRDIFALSLSPLDMTFYGVPMHSHISAPNRSDAQEVPVMYFLRPTKKNLQAVSSDMKNDKYECAYIHASGPTNATDWEPIREEANRGKIKSACSVYSDFLSLGEQALNPQTTMSVAMSVPFYSSSSSTSASASATSSSSAFSFLSLFSRSSAPPPPRLLLLISSFPPLSTQRTTPSSSASATATIACTNRRWHRACQISSTQSPTAFSTS
eukprot:1601578-Rhodomonas_salina.1